jgi:lon-related putative ATP-dependent protease
MPSDDSPSTDQDALPPKALGIEILRKSTDLSSLAFDSTDDLKPVDGFTGQDRARDSVRFGSAIDRSGFNLFVIGSTEASMQRAVETMIRTDAPRQAKLSDWIYVNNFIDVHKPVAIRLPVGRAAGFRAAMQELIEDLKVAIPSAFESEDYQSRRAAIDKAFQEKQESAIGELGSRTAAQNVLLIRTPLGFAFVPGKDGEVVQAEDFAKWDQAAQARTQELIRHFEKDLEHIMHQIPSWNKARRDEIRTLNRETARVAIGHLIAEVKTGFSDLAEIAAHMEAVESDLIENIGVFVKSAGEENAYMDIGLGGPFDRYQVNVLVTQADGAAEVPIVKELHPTLANLVGRVEYLARQGALVTNFRMIKAGAIHRANGGYLLLDARALLVEPFSWSALKRTLKSGKIAIEDAARFLGFASTVTLEPDPIPLELKVILFGDRFLYYLLSAYDPELLQHFKVLADFEDDFDRSTENEIALAHLIASLVRDNRQKPLDRGAVCLVIEQAARLASHSAKLSLLVDRLDDLIAEADFEASRAGRQRVSRQDVQAALDAQTRRVSRLRDRGQEAMLQDVALIDTAGMRTGQVNGLSVIELAGFMFGRPTRITCRVRAGGGNVIDIERETKLGGPIHSKGVLILSGFLAGAYALDTPMSLSASLVFEQSYGGVEGDSASSAELYALLSALSGYPLRQDIAVTGSVNQHGEVQAIGGVNEKIEGFFDICNARGLTGTQGVAIPKANIQHLMLRQDVVDACANGRFAVYPIAHIDEGIALLTNFPAGRRDGDGNFPAASVNAAIEEKLRHYASILQRYGDRKPPSTGRPQDEP